MFLSSPRIARRLITATGVLFFAGLSAAGAQSNLAALKPLAQADRVSASASLASRTALSGTLPRWIQSAQQSAASFDLSQKLSLQVVLRRDAGVEASLETLLAAQQTPSSPMYHQWLTPAQFGTLYGPTDNDLKAVENWLTSEGLTIDAVEPNRVVLDVSAPAATIASALRTSFANFQLGSATRFSVTSEPQVPTALITVIRQIAGVTQQLARPNSIPGVMTTAPQRLQTSPAQAAGIASPEHTSQSSGSISIFPDDFNTIYDSASILSAGNKGATIGSKAQHIAVITRSRIASTDATEYETLAGLPSYVPNVVIADGDPGTAGGDEQVEAQLDFDRAYGTAPGAAIDMVTGAITKFADPLYTLSAYNVNTLLDPIMTLSYGSCEADGGPASNFNSIFQQAAAEGIAVFVSSGDNGADGCLAGGPIASGSAVSGSVGVNGLCGPYVTCVGGTEFIDAGLTSTYWNTTNDSAGGSAKGYIPEGAWNEFTCTVSSSCPTGYEIAAGGGGASVYYTKPSWQTGTGVPADGSRDEPDMALVSASHEGFFLCVDFYIAPYGCSTTPSYGLLVGGTSAAAPSMAGIAALLNTAAGSTQGFLNPLLYKLAASSPTAFHDVTVASSGVSNCTAATASLCNNTDPSGTSANAGVVGYAVTTGYDQATGLGSVDVANLLKAVTGSTSQATSLVVTASPSPATTSTAVTLTATLSPYTITSGTATGTVQFYLVSGATTTALGSAAAISTTGTATLSYTFSTAGTYQIDAVYSGDTKFGGSTAATITLVVNSSSFTITPASTVYPASGTLTSGTVVADGLTVASTNGFAGSVALNCAVTNGSGTAAGSCSVSPTLVTLAANGTATSALTITTTAGSSGTLRVVLTGVNGSTSIISPTITLTLTAPSFTISASPSTATIPVGGTATSTVSVTSVNGFTGSVALSCPLTAVAGSGNSVPAGTCTISPASVTVSPSAAATATATIISTGANSGVLDASVSGTGTTSGASVASTYACNATTPCIAVTVTPPFSLTAASSSVSFVSGATTGNTDIIAVTAASGFAGAVALQCNISSSAAAYQPSCAVSPTSVSLTSGSTSNATLTISSTTAVTTTSAAKGSVTASRMGGTLQLGALLAILTCMFALRRRRLWSGVALVMLLAMGCAAMSGCGDNTAPKTTTTKSSAGSYTVTVTGTSTVSGTTVSTNTTFGVTIQ